MCGILGQISFSKNNAINKNQFKKALLLQQHRGPDNNNVYHDMNFMFGHTRLSIIDLNTNANQPMVSKCKNYILVFNGEIYNYQEIRQKLMHIGYTFQTDSDTEALLNAFIEYGIDAIEQFNGMFAFAIYDRRKDECYIVRDRLGIKPLYYSIGSDGFIFSSEIKSILMLDQKKRELDHSAISSYLSFRYPILDNTFFQGIHSLAPAHYIKLSQGNMKIVEYWNVAHKFKEQAIDKGEKYYRDKLKSLLESAVQYRMISDVPIGAFLSGGVDSSIITALMAKNTTSPVKTFTIGFKEKGFNEFDYASIVAEKYHTEHREIILSGKNYMETMEQLIEYKDAPLSVPNEVPLYLMSQKLKKYITVVLSGEGADEIFGGYGRIFRSPYDLERIRMIDELGFTDEEKRALSQNFLKKYLVDNFKNDLSHFINIYSYTSYSDKKALLSDFIDLASIEERLINKFMMYFDELEDESYYNKVMYAFEKVHIVGLLHRVDTSTMAASVEARVPFVDHRLIEFAFTVPVKYKLKWLNNKAQESSKTLMSDKISEIYDTPKYLLKKSFENMIPRKVLYRKKMGFPVPLNDWFGGSFNDYAKNVLLTEKAKGRNLYNISTIEQWLNSDRLLQDHDFAMKIWMLVNLEIFIQKYFDSKDNQ